MNEVSDEDGHYKDYHQDQVIRMQGQRLEQVHDNESL